MNRANTNGIDVYQTIADSLIASGKAEAGTMMGHPCLRRNGHFVATAGHDDDELIVKLTADRVQELIAAGTGQPFAPAGKTFREWVAIPAQHASTWASLIYEALEGALPPKDERRTLPR
jgi:hypothetical protein